MKEGSAYSVRVSSLFIDRQSVKMAKGGATKRIIIKLLSTANTGFFYTTSKNVVNTPHKIKLMKYDPIVRKHVLFTEAKMPSGKKR